MNPEITRKDCRIINSAQDVLENLRFFAQLPALYSQLTDTEIDRRFASFVKIWGNCFILISKGETLIASATFIIMKMPTKCRGFIEDVVVDKAYRRAGIGKLLIEEAVRLGRENDCQYIQLTSKPGRTAANDFYPSLGFELVALAVEGNLRGTNLYRYYL